MKLIKSNLLGYRHGCVIPFAPMIGGKNLIQGDQGPMLEIRVELEPESEDMIADTSDQQPTDSDTSEIA